MELVLQMESNHGTAALVCRGELICGKEAEALHEALSRLQAASERVALDLGWVSKIDCAGIGVIASAALRAKRNGRVFELVSVPDRVWRVLRVTGLHKVLTIQGVQPASVVFAA